MTECSAYVLEWLVKFDSCCRVEDDINVFLQICLLIVLQPETFVSDVSTHCKDFRCELRLLTPQVVKQLSMHQPPKISRIVLHYNTLKLHHIDTRLHCTLQYQHQNNNYSRILSIKDHLITGDYP